jgi:hypothetical protein
MIVEYDTMPFKVFFKILKDEEKNLHLLGIEDLEEAKEVWKSIKEDWQERHPSKNTSKLLSAYKKVLLESIAIKRDVALFQYLMGYDGDVKPLYEKLKIKYHDNPLERFEYLSQQIEKSKTKLEIFDARLKEVEKECEEDKVESKGMDFSDLNKSIASLELHGFAIENYENLTCGKYDAITEIIREKAKK